MLNINELDECLQKLLNISKKIYKSNDKVVEKIKKKANEYINQIIIIKEWEIIDKDDYFYNLKILNKNLLKNIPDFLIEHFKYNNFKSKNIIKKFYQKFISFDKIVDYFEIILNDCENNYSKKIKELKKNYNYENIKFDKNSIDIILFHKNCSDGIGSLIAIDQYYDKNNLKKKYNIKGLKHTYDLDQKLIKNKNVLVCDLSLSKEKYEYIQNLCKNLLIIDHHKTSIKNTINIKNKIIDMKHSAAYLTWKYFLPFEEVPKLINYIEDHDLWKFDLKSSREIYSSLKHIDKDLNNYKKLLDKQEFNNLLNIGEKLYNIEKNKIKKLCSYAKKYNQRIKGKNNEISAKSYDIYYVNSSIFTNELGNYLVENFDCDLSIVYNYDEKTNKTFMSLRSNNKKDIDVSKIAEVYNGGGHKHAAAFCLSGFKNKI